MRWKLAIFVLMLAVALSSAPVLRLSLRAVSKNLKFNTREPFSVLFSRQIASAPVLQQRLPEIIEMASSATSGHLPTALPANHVESNPKSELPKLSQADFQLYNKMAVMMDYYHNNFRTTWNTLYQACESNRRPHGMSISQFLSLATQFTHHLTVHHTIEERHIFPILAAKMPEFRSDAAMLTQHQGIHAGIDAMEAYVAEVRRGERELVLSGLKGVMDSFGAVLWRHLDEEVRNLGAENMRLYWTREDMKGFNF